VVFHDRIYYVGKSEQNWPIDTPLSLEMREKRVHPEDGQATCEIKSRLIQECETPMLYYDSNDSSLISRSKVRTVAFAASIVAPWFYLLSLVVSEEIEDKFDSPKLLF
jgi:hypothetical protein